MHRRNQLKILYLYCNFEYIRDRGKSQSIMNHYLDKYTYT